MGVAEVVVCIVTCHVYNTSGWTTENDQWNLSAQDGFLDSLGQDRSVRLVDLNGDGLVDYFRRSTLFARMLINNGSGWTNATQDWNVTANMSLTLNDTWDNAVRFVDLNGDGRLDLIRRADCATAGCLVVLLNNGTGWQSTTLFNLSQTYAFTNAGVRLIDLNGDGLVDVIKRQDCTMTNCSGVLLNNGSGWTNDTGRWNISQGIAFVSSGVNTAVRLSDLNGDGLTDIIKSRDGGEPVLTANWRNAARRNFALYKVRYPLGGTVIIDYAPSTTFNNTGNDSVSDLPVAISVVLSIQTDNGFVDNRWCP